MIWLAGFMVVSLAMVTLTTWKIHRSVTHQRQVRQRYRAKIDRVRNETLERCYTDKQVRMRQTLLPTAPSPHRIWGLGLLTVGSFWAGSPVTGLAVAVGDGLWSTWKRLQTERRLLYDIGVCDFTLTCNVAFETDEKWLWMRVRSLFTLNFGLLGVNEANGQYSGLPECKAMQMRLQNLQDDWCISFLSIVIKCVQDLVNELTFLNRVFVVVVVLMWVWARLLSPLSFEDTERDINKRIQRMKELEL